MAAKKHQYEALYCNEWSVPYWLLGIAALLLGALSYVVHQAAPAYTGVFSNIMFLSLLVLLSLFYKKLYITRVEVRIEAEEVVLLLKKMVLPQSRRIAFSEITGIGIDKTEGLQGLIKVPEKHWLLIRYGKKRIFLYEQDSQREIKAVFRKLLEEAPQAERLEHILK
jgi:hypothetical protein